MQHSASASASSLRTMKRSASASSLYPLLSDGRIGIRSFAFEAKHTDWPQTSVHALLNFHQAPIAFQTDKYRVGLFVPSAAGHALKESCFPVSNPSLALRRQASVQHLRRRRAWDEHVKAEHLRRHEMRLRNQIGNSRASAAALASLDPHASRHHRSAPLLPDGQVQAHRAPPVPVVPAASSQRKPQSIVMAQNGREAANYTREPNISELDRSSPARKRNLLPAHCQGPELTTCIIALCTASVERYYAYSSGNSNAQVLQRA